MKLIIGLGNPDSKYTSTRHNFGFRAVEAFAERHGFPEFKLEKKFKAEISEGQIDTEKILLVKPQTYMNLSGETAAALLNFYKPHLNDFLVIFDDVDMEFGTTRIRAGGSSGGHNGIKSLIRHFGTENFARLKLGIRSELIDVVPTEEFVLMKFSPSEEQVIPQILDQAVVETENFLNNGVQENTWHLTIDTPNQS